LRGRYHPDLADADVEGLNFSSLSFEVISQMRGRRGWAQIMARNKWFQRKVVSVLSAYQPSTLNSQPVVFAYSYAALDLLEHVKKRGWSTVLGQIDAGPVEEKIVAEEVACESELGAPWQPAPQAYWDLWSEECNLADRIVVNSEWSRSALIKAGIDGDKLSVIPLAFEGPSEGPPAKQYPKKFSPERPMRILFLGQIHLRKGVARLLKAIRLLENEPIEFQFVGPVQISIPHDLQNNPHIRWLGAVSRSEVGAFYGNADVLIFPTLSDGFGLTQLEAQAWSLPIIASQYCGEVVTNGTNGLVLTGLSGETIADALRSCLCEPSQLRSFAANAGLGEKFKLKTVAKKLRGLFESPVRMP
jgi:glycosyltransferase involved in cell wall biosynthesis